MSEPIIAVFRGGVSREYEVSMESGAASLAALRRFFDQVEDFEVNDRGVPAGIMADTHVVFSMLHGEFGEDGDMQELLDARGIAYAGCDAESSRLCFNKQRTKETVAAAGVPVAPGVLVGRDETARADALIKEFGPRVVVKPNCQGSSVGLHIADTATGLAWAIETAGSNEVVVETCVTGMEVSIGVLDDESMGVVEISPKSGLFDYASKYTKGLTEYHAPARLDRSLIERIRNYAAAAFHACRCRDFARVDFMISKGGYPMLLEVNTLPGLKETSLLPMSAHCVDLDFDALICRMVNPTIARFHATRSHLVGRML